MSRPCLAKTYTHIPLIQKNKKKHPIFRGRKENALAKNKETRNKIPKSPSKICQVLIYVYIYIYVCATTFAHDVTIQTPKSCKTTLVL